MFVLQTRGFCSRLWRTQRFTREGRRWGGGGGGERHTGAWRAAGVFRLQASPACHHDATWEGVNQASLLRT